MTAKEAYDKSMENALSHFYEIKDKALNEIDSACALGKVCTRVRWYDISDYMEYKQAAQRVKDWLKIYGYKVTMTSFWTQCLIISWDLPHKTSNYRAIEL